MSTERLVLEPLRVEHADEAAVMLSDVGLYRFIGGDPPSADELRVRYQRQVIGQSPDGTQGWFNWMLRHRQSGTLAGYVQASLAAGDVAELAWVTAASHQRQGYAVEAARAVQEWLRSQGIQTFHASIHPGHAASQRVARRLGLTPTDVIVDGEVRWTS